MARVLVAEDDNFLAKAYTAKLKKAGYEVLVVANGEEFFQQVSNFKPDLAIVDLVMPKMDGFGVLQKIKSTPELANLPVIVASNLSQSEDLEKAKKLGAVDYLVKADLSMTSLIDKINKFAAKKA